MLLRKYTLDHGDGRWIARDDGEAVAESHCLDNLLEECEVRGTKLAGLTEAAISELSAFISA